MVPKGPGALLLYMYIYGGMSGRAVDNSVSICLVLEFVLNEVDSAKCKTWFLWASGHALVKETDK